MLALALLSATARLEILGAHKLYLVQLEDILESESDNLMDLSSDEYADNLLNLQSESTNAQPQSKLDKFRSKVNEHGKKAVAKIKEMAQDGVVQGGFFMLIGFVFTFLGVKFYKFLIATVPAITIFILLSIVIKSTILQKPQFANNWIVTAVLYLAITFLSIGVGASVRKSDRLIFAFLGSISGFLISS